jgi:L-alanine-DL-glutamate epimerase-like enolase superfamily enzyme
MIVHSAVSAFIVDASWRNWIFLKVETDSGFVGWGECTLEGRENAVVGVIPNTLVSGAEWGGYVGAIEDWLDAVRGAPLRSTTSRDGFRAIALAEAIKLSADKFGEPIQVLS